MDLVQGDYRNQRGQSASLDLLGIFSVLFYRASTGSVLESSYAGVGMICGALIGGCFRAKEEGARLCSQQEPCREDA